MVDKITARIVLYIESISGLYNGDTLFAWILNKIAIKALFLTFLLFLNGANPTFKVKYNY